MADEDDILKQYYGPNTGSTEQFLTQYNSSPAEPYNVARNVADTHKQEGGWGVAKRLANSWASGGAGLIGGMVSAPYHAAKNILENYRPGAENEVVNQDIGKDAFDAGSANMAGAVVPRPANSLGTFAGVKAKTADLAKLETAKEMLERGFGRDSVWQDTGWFQGRDGQWRFEIDDSKSGFVRPQTKHSIDNFPIDKPGVHEMGQAYKHPPLYEAYPELAGSHLEFRDLTKSSVPEARGAVVGDKTYMHTPPDRYGDNMVQARSTMLHEIQHRGPQHIEGFDQGSNPTMFHMRPKDVEAVTGQVAMLDDAMLLRGVMDQQNVPAWEAAKILEKQYGRSPHQYADGMATDYQMADLQARRERAQVTLDRARDPWDSYRRTAGEVEARNVQARRDLDYLQRKQAPPWKTQDVPDEQQIISPQQSSTLYAGGNRKAAGAVAAKDILEAEYGKGPFEAAIRVGDRTFTGANHGVAYDNAVAALGEAEVGRLTGEAYALAKAKQMGGGPADYMWQDSPVDGFVSGGRYYTRSEATAAMNRRGASVEPTYAMTAEDLDEIRAARPDLLFAGGNRKAAAGVAAKDILEKEYGKGAKPDVETIRAYHGSTTPGGFDKFKRKQNDLGVHFGTADQANDRIAYMDAVTRDSKKPRGYEGAHILPVDLDIKNPLRLPDLGGWDADNLSWALKKVIPEADVDRAMWSSRTPQGQLTALRDLITRKGYDGVVYKNTGEVAGSEPYRIARDQAQQEMYKALGIKPNARSYGISAEQEQLPAYKAYRDADKAYSDFREKNGQDSYIAIKPGTVHSATTGSTLFAGGDGKAAGAVAAKEILEEQYGKGAAQPNPPARFPRTEADLDPNTKFDPGTIFRGVEGGTDAQKAIRVAEGGDLGDGVYLTGSKDLAGSYGGGPKASVQKGTRVVHDYKLAGPIYPEDVAYMFGGMKHGENVRLVTGNGIEIYNGPWDGGMGPGKSSQMEAALRDAGGIKAVVGTPDSIGVNQISIRDKSLLVPAKKP